MQKTIISFLLASLPALAGPIGYVINFSGQFGTMDLNTGAFTPLGPGVASNSAGGLGGTPGGQTYSVDADGNLIRFSTAGAVIVVGDTHTGPGMGPNGISVLGSLTTGALFALDFSNHLFSVNTATAAVTQLGALGLPLQEQQYDGNMVTSFNGDGTFLYYTLEISGGAKATGPTLFRINPANLQITSVAMTGLAGRIIGSGFVGSIFYGFTDDGHILSINKNTGAATVVATYNEGSPPGGGPPFSGVFGVVATPEPGMMLVSGLGIFAILAGRLPR